MVPSSGPSPLFNAAHPSSPPGPSILLIGMRGAGKTTLGALVASHLNLPFLDADALFCSDHPGHSPPTFVKQFGWPVFRQAETDLLERILADIDRGERKVVSLGGGVVEEPRNRQLLKMFWGGSATDPRLGRERGVVIHVFREIEQVFAEPGKAGGRQAPQWKVGGTEEVWARRRPWFRECSSHEFINFTNAPNSTPEDAGEDQVAKATAHRMQFEQVERDFIRFFRRILAPYNAQTPLANPPFATASTSTRTYLVTLPFPDLTPYVPSLHVLCTGASAIELRADLLSDPHPHPRPGVAEAYENPSLSYISEQFALLRRHAPDLPIVFTLRTPAQGGKYPYPSGANEAGMFATLHHALKLGADLIDIEQGLDPVRTAQVVADAKQRQTTVIISWRDVVGPASGGFSWDGPHATARYCAAVAMGADVVKIVGTASDVQDNFLLRVFAFSDLVKTGPPLSAYNMGPYGRLSRFLNPLLASVTHPVARKGTVRGVIGAPSMTFREVQMALHLSGLLSTRHFIPFARGEEVGSRPVLRELCVRGFDDLGLPFDLLDPDWTTVGPETSFKDALALYRGEPFFAGGSVGEENGVEAMGEMDEVTEVAQSVGGIDAFIVLPPTGTGPPNLKGDHVYTRALVNVLGARLSPSNAVSPASFALVLSPTFADLSISSTSPFSISSHLPSTSHCNSLHVRSIFSALSRLGIRQVAVVDPALASLEELAAKRPTIVVSLGDGNELSPHQVESLLTSPTGGVVMSLAPHFSSPPPNPSRQPNATNTLLDVAREPSRARRGWIAVSSEAVEEEFASAVFKFWTERTCPPSSVL